MFLVGNRLFKSLEDAQKFCKECDFNQSEMILQREQKYKNVIEYILGKFYNVENNYKSETMEMFFDIEDEKEHCRQTMNDLSDCYREYFTFVYQGTKNGQQWYKINIIDLEGLNETFESWSRHYNYFKPA